MKKCTAIKISAFILLLLILSGCGSSAPANSQGAAANPPAAISDISAVTGKKTEYVYIPPQGVDISKEVHLTMYVLGDIPSDIDLVYQEVNKMLKDRINATIEMKYLSWGEWTSKYSLVLASGEDLDLMYTSDWANYSTESAKGAFYELTDDFINTYMPYVAKSQNPASLKQATIDGRLYAIPKNTAGLENEGWVIIRKDLEEKYGMSNIDSIEKLEEYYKAVLANESGVLPYAHAQITTTGAFNSVAWRQPNHLSYLTNIDWCYKYPGNNAAPDFSEITYCWYRDDAIPYYELMKKWADLGFWSKNAISNTEQTRDAFENGKSASLIWNETIFLAGRNLRSNNPEWDFEVLDVSPGTPRKQALFTNDAVAITSSSKNPERAAMFIDFVKSDLDFYFQICGGIKDKHYEIINDGTQWTLGPDADKYPWTPSLWCFNWNESTYPTDATVLPEQLEFRNIQEKLLISPDIAAFRFDMEPVKNEMAAINALAVEYGNILELGMAPDIQATLNEWKQKANSAGMGRIEAELEKQYNAWKSTL
ncbi:MAG: ABC transporter substrate-binding protein [Clostridiales bacterium]|nr:ABC transporter substrate-binding protein [Clostridiales bacterium]